MDDIKPKPNYALVTGGTKRLGLSMVWYLADRGFDVAIHCNNSESEALKLSAELKARHNNGRLFPIVKHDLNNWQNALQLFEALPANFGPLDVLVNNASMFQPASIGETTADMLQQNFAVHLFSPFMLMTEFRRRYGAGCIVNMLDTKVVTNQHTHAAYLLSKKSLAHLTAMAALEFAPAIRVNGIAPGPVLPATGAKTATFDVAVKATPLQTAVPLTEITAALGFFIDNQHVTGQLLFLDSGSHLNGL
jgi:pteridine reductase